MTTALSSVPFSKVSITGAFWSERLATIIERTIPSQYERLTEYGILDSLKLPQPSPPLRIPENRHGFSTQIFWDSDVGKWIEAASYALSFRRDAKIEAQIEAIIDDLEQAQSPDGYLNCWYLGRDPDNRWTNLRDNHELYCAGHLLEGAIAYWQVTGRDRLLSVLRRYVDHIAYVFGPSEDQRKGYPGHQELELALIKLWQATGDKAALDLARYFIDERGAQPHYFDVEARARGEDPSDFWAKSYEYNQSHLPVRDQTKVVGHAVRAMYMYAAMADLAAIDDDESLKTACEALWADLTERRMYVTGGFGPSASNEGFTTDWDLPNETAYAETCASCAMVFWAARMLNLDLDGRYGDILELALYNNVLSGLSRDGTQYFYDNTLASDGSHQRWDWHPCPCCTMNVSRLVASVGGYYYGTNADGIAIHMYGGARVSLEVGGTGVTLDETSAYPWDGAIRIAVSPDQPMEFCLSLRIPAWSGQSTVRVNGVTQDVAIDRGYARLSRLWSLGDVVEVQLQMRPERLWSHPMVAADRGCVALRRGPLVYCAEAVDNDVAPDLVRLPDTGALTAEASDSLGGIVMLTADATVLQTSDWGADLYRTSPPTTRPTTLRLIPYYLRANRSPSAMRVWIET